MPCLSLICRANHKHSHFEISFRFASRVHRPHSILSKGPKHARQQRAVRHLYRVAVKIQARAISIGFVAYSSLRDKMRNLFFLDRFQVVKRTPYLADTVPWPVAKDRVMVPDKEPLPRVKAIKIAAI
jgi:hypothetical protein